MPGRFIARSGAPPGTLFPLGPATTTIGRAEDNDIVVPGGHASRYHARVEWDGAVHTLIDLGSKNGTRLNGAALEGSAALVQGDVVDLPGLSLTFDLTMDTMTIAAPGPKAIEEPGLRVDAATAEVWVRGERVNVTAKEFLALSFLYAQDGALVSKESLAAGVWPEYEGAVGDYNIEQLIFRLRRKIEPVPEQPRHLVTVRGLGYRLIP